MREQCLKARVNQIAGMIAFLLVMTTSATLHGVIRNVPAEYGTIQAAVDSALDQDTVLIGPGSYTTSVRLWQKALVIMGSFGADSTRLVAAVGQSFVDLAPAPKVTRFIGLHFDQYHTVLFAFGSVAFHECRITRPIGILPSTTSITFMTSGLVDKCEFVGVAGKVIGGSMNDGSNLVIQNSFFHLQQSESELEYWIIYIGSEDTDTGEVLIRNNLIIGDGYVNAIGIRERVIGEISNNTIVSCRRGLQVDIYARVHVFNNIVANCPELGTASWSSPLDYNNFWNNGINYFQGIPPGPNDISADPLFVDPANGDYSLMCNSPCIDAGDPASAGFAGKRRDIGAFEYQYTVGNADGNFGSTSINLTDAVFLVNHIFVSGPAPCPAEAGMLDCDDLITISDVVYLINYLYSHGPAPCLSNQ